MEEECQRLKIEYQDQVETINVKTELEIERMTPMLENMKNERSDLEKQLAEARREREALEGVIRLNENKNLTLMREYCHDKKAHHE